MRLKRKNGYLAPKTEVVILKLENVILNNSTLSSINDSIENSTVGW